MGDKRRKIWVPKSYQLSPAMQEHVNSGGSLYLLTEQDDSNPVLISTLPDRGMTGLCSYVSRDAVWQQVRLKDTSLPYLPEAIREHVDHGGKLYRVGGITEAGNVEVATEIQAHGGSRTMIKASDVEYVTAEEQEFADAVANIPEKGQTITQ